MSGVNVMSLQVEIPDEIADSMRLPDTERKQRIKLELALSLYSQRILSFGKARQLAGMSKYHFGQMLGEREIPRHYDLDDLGDDLDYASRK